MYFSSSDNFLPFEYVLGTLIHEVTHISIGPHSVEFYQLMESLESEVEKDLAHGVNRDGNLRFAAFTGTARRLGFSNSCGQSNCLDKKRLREVQVDAALRREKHLQLSIGSGQKLGHRHEPLIPTSTSSSSSSLSSSLTNTISNTTTITIKPNLLRSGIPETSSLLQSSISSLSNISNSNSNRDSNTTTTTTTTTNIKQERYWSCSKCTYFNSTTITQCQVCSNIRVVKKSLANSILNPPSLPPESHQLNSIQTNNLPRSLILEQNDSSSLKVNYLQEVINLVDEEDTKVNKTADSTKTRNCNNNNNTDDNNQIVNVKENQSLNIINLDDDTIWICSKCTYENSINNNSCIICNSKF